LKECIAAGRQVIEGQISAQETILEQSEETAMLNDTFRQHLSDNYRLLVTETAYGRFVESFGTQTLLPPLPLPMEYPFQDLTRSPSRRFLPREIGKRTLTWYKDIFFPPLFPALC
jgi:hypothetical protein